MTSLPPPLTMRTLSRPSVNTSKNSMSENNQRYGGAEREESIRLTGVIRVVYEGFGRPGQVENDKLSIVTTTDNCFIKLDSSVHSSNICILPGTREKYKIIPGTSTCPRTICHC